MSVPIRTRSFGSPRSARPRRKSGQSPLKRAKKESKTSFVDNMMAKFKSNKSERNITSPKLKPNSETPVSAMKMSHDYKKEEESAKIKQKRERSKSSKSGKSSKTTCFKFWMSKSQIINDNYEQGGSKSNKNGLTSTTPTVKGAEERKSAGNHVEAFDGDIESANKVIGNWEDHEPRGRHSEGMVIRRCRDFDNEEEVKNLMPEREERPSERPLERPSERPSLEPIDTGKLDKEKKKKKDDQGYTSSDEETTEFSAFIPCLLLQSSLQCSKILVYFHANSEDISHSHELLVTLKNHLMINILAVEYPGYGIYRGSASTAKLLYDADQVWSYLTNHLKIPPSNIIIFGRSIGTGPATYLASKYNPGALILLSAFKSVKLVARHLFGAFGQFLVKEQLNNLEWISQVKCPILLVHGRRDTLVPIEHAEALRAACNPSTSCKLVVNEEMTHNKFDRLMDMTIPISDFLKTHNIISSQLDTTNIQFPKTLFIPH